jgi:hypothetical protein
MLLPLYTAVGDANWQIIPPDAIHERFNPWAKTKLLVINEIRTTDSNFRKYDFYNRLKPYTAAPPLINMMELKGINHMPVMNLMTVVLTTNELMSMHMPDNDRRFAVADSAMMSPMEEGSPVGGDYFKDLYAYLHGEGTAAVIWHLLDMDLNAFDPKQAPAMSMAKMRLIEDGRHALTCGPMGDLIEAWKIVLKYGGDNEFDPCILFPADLTAMIAAWDFGGMAKLDGLLARDKKVYSDELFGRSLHRRFENHGFDCVLPEFEKWRHKDFQSRSAFIEGKKSDAEARRRIEIEVTRRPLNMLNILAAARKRYEAGMTLVPPNKPF